MNTHSAAPLWAATFYAVLNVGISHGVAQPFTTIYNVPGDVPPNPLPSDTQLNLSDGGSIGDIYLVGNTSGTSSNLELNVFGGTVGNNLQARPGSTINISGGVVGDYLDAYSNSTVNISGGVVGDYLDAINGGTVNISGGVVGNYLTAYNDSTVDITGGRVGHLVEARSGSYVNVGGGEVGSLNARGGSLVSLTGGTAGDFFTAEEGAVVYLTGGTVGNFFSAYPGSRLNIYGNEFLLNGGPVPGFILPGSVVTLRDFQDSILTGTLEDGSVFILSSGFIDNVIGDGVIKLYRSDIPSKPLVIDVPSSPTPGGIRAGQTLNLHTNGVIGDNFDAVRGTLNIAGGVVGENLELIDTTVNLIAGEIGFGVWMYTDSSLNIDAGSVGDYLQVADGSTVILSDGQIGDWMSAGGYYETDSNVVVTINGGSIGEHFHAEAQSTVNIHGGSIGQYFYLRENSTANMTGGEIGDDAQIETGSTLNLSGGSLGRHIEAGGGSTVNLSGGEIGSDFDAFSGSFVNIVGTSFYLDNTDLLPGMSEGVPLVVTQRNRRLWGTLADGTHFSFNLNSTNSYWSDYFSPGMTLTITLASLGGDLNGDGFVGIEDLNIVLGNWNHTVSAGDPLLGDPTGDGFVGIEDLNAVLSNWNAGTPAVPGNGANIPEPGTLALSGLIVGSCTLSRKRPRG